LTRTATRSKKAPCRGGNPGRARTKTNKISPVVIISQDRQDGKEEIVPKVIFTEEARRNAALTALIDSRIGRGRRFRTLADLAEALHMPRQTFYQKLKSPAEKFSYWQVCEIFRLLRATDREVANVAGVKYAGATKAETSAALAEAIR